MYTVLTKQIDGYNVITGFGKQVIDPESTKNAVGDFLDNTDEKKAVVEKLQEIGPVVKQFQDLKTAARVANEQGNESLAQKHIFERGQVEGRLDTLWNELTELKKAVAEKYREIWKENLVYFEPKTGEVAITDDEYYELNNTISGLKNAVLTIDKQQIDDYRGVKYVKDGKVCTVERLGEQPGGPLQEDVTPEEFEQMRLDAMTQEEKDAELAGVIDGLAAQAANMASKLEIQGVADSLQQARTWYNAEVTKAEQKYGAA